MTDKLTISYEARQRDEILQKIKKFALSELKDNILPFWVNHTIDNENGGFIGKVSDQNEPDKKAHKGLILNTRILWTFSFAARMFKNEPKYKELADRAYQYIIKHFYDTGCKGFYWSLNYKGDAVDTKKQIYAQAFSIYALAEYYMLTKNQESIDTAIETFHLIQKYSYDTEKSGYLEAFDRNWQVLDDLRLSEKDMNEKKTMNTHLHVIESFTNLYRVYRDDNLRSAIVNLLDVFYNIIINQTDYHFNLFFDENWQVKSNQISFGHDIEGSWLLLEAAEVINEKKLIDQFKEVALKMAGASLHGINKLEGLSHDGERGKPLQEGNVEWWVQAEALVGFLNAFQVSNNDKYLHYTNQILEYINKYVIDHEYGEWHHQIDFKGRPVSGFAKVGFWKCPYHNSRMCYEALSRI